ncbi:DMT family transporter [Deferribacter thermophilus]|uniref:DMT family transporter n=1 Tax=Deferribacter thermophilus TaxID=53573 RepID=UPI003C1D626F
MAYILLSLSALFWAGNFVIGKWISASIPPVALVFWRWVVAFIILLPFTANKIYQQKHLIQKNIKLLAAFGFLGVTLFNTLIYKAMHYTTAINALLINSFVPILIFIISFFIHKLIAKKLQILGAIISLIGVIIIITKGDLNSLITLKINPGDILVLIAALSWALYSVLLKNLDNDLHPLVFLETIIFIGLLFLFPIYLFSNKSFEVNIKNIFVILYVGIFASVLAFICWNRGIKEVGANKGGNFIHLMPVFGTIMSILLLGEQFFFYHFIAIILVFSGIVLNVITK